MFSKAVLLYPAISPVPVTSKSTTTSYELLMYEELSAGYEHITKGHAKRRQDAPLSPKDRATRLVS